MSESVVVTSAESKQSLAVTRTLAKAGYDVSAAGSSRFSQTFYSRYCLENYIIPDPQEKPKSYISQLQSIVRNTEPDILLPVTAADTMVLSHHQEEFDDVTIATDSFENIQLAHDKERAVEHAKENSVPVPETYCPTSEEELHEIASTVEYPVVVKLRKTAASTGLRYAHSRDELLSTYSISGSRGMAVDYSRPLIQEYIPGEIHDVCVLFENGELKKALTQKRIRTFPASGGAGVVNKTTWRPDLIEHVKDLLAPLNWDGVAQVEFMDSETLKEPKLIEINPKIWGTIELSIDVGVDFAKSLIDMKLGKSVDGPTSDYEANSYFIWYEGGLLGNLYESKGFLKPLWEVNNVRRKKYATNISSSDFLPHVVRSPQLVSLSIDNLLEKWR